MKHIKVKQNLSVQPKKDQIFTLTTQCTCPFVLAMGFIVPFEVHSITKFVNYDFLVFLQFVNHFTFYYRCLSCKMNQKTFHYEQVFFIDIIMFMLVCNCLDVKARQKKSVNQQTSAKTVKTHQPFFVFLHILTNTLVKKGKRCNNFTSFE